MPAGLGGVVGTIISLSLFLELDSYKGSIPSTLLLFSALSAAISAASALVNALAEALL